jgi:Spy/CpxP family protein refolding chaperone
MSRSFLGIAALLVVAGGFVVADDKTPDTKAPAVKGRAPLPQHWTKLGLTDAQRDKVYDIRSSYRAKIDDLERQIKDLRKKERAEMEEVLTDAQKSRLRELMLEQAPAEKPEKKP